MMKRLYISILFIMAFAVNLTAQEKKIWAKSIIDQLAPELVVENWLTEEPNTEGKFILIDFWATWCGPCKKAIPEMNAYQEEFKDDLVVIGISDEPEYKVKRLLRPKINYYSAIDTKAVLKNYLQVEGIPHVILIDPKGIVRWEGFPSLPGHELTTEVIHQIIKTYK